MRKETSGYSSLKKIANELTAAIKRNISIDWHVRTSAQAGMRRIIKRLLKKYDYPPKQVKNALDVVMRQAELMCGNVKVEDMQAKRETENK
ncbi:type I restriction enzyme endonuclease domain-containing protein [Halalkalibacter lacteus]|uniref:type I restriction enzyme endonuclease domain-containing protein n=1 Tax=Halalkalibacter lacteus TaxID=3090663 RepID=UPI002FC9D9D5